MINLQTRKQLPKTAAFIAAPIVIAALLAGCAGSSPLASVNDSIELIINGMKDAEFDQQYVDSIPAPYTAMSAKIGLGPLSLLVGERHGNKIKWYSADRAMLITENGRLIATAGMPIDLITTSFPRDDLLPTLTPETNASISYRLADFSFGHYYGIPIESTIRYNGHETLSIMGTDYSTDHYVEDFTSETLDWEGSNEFWIDESGVVRQSVQHFVPKQPPVIMRLLRQ